MSPKPQPRRRIPLVAVLVGVIAVILVGVIAVNLITKDDSSSSDAVSETGTITVDGESLPEFPGNGVADPGVGSTAPVVKGQSFTGEAESIGGATGKPTLVMFVAHWCPHCQREVPRVVDWVKDGTIPSDVDLVAVSTAVNRAPDNYPPSAWLEREGWPGRIIADDQSDSAALAYSLPAYPYFVALDADGKVVARGQGELDQQAVTALVEQMKAS